MNGVGLLGGTFDPVHLGHLQLGKAVLEQCGLEKIVFIPSAHPPHKRPSAITGIDHRLQMLRLAITPHRRFEISEIEIGRDDLSYTFETVALLRHEDGHRRRHHFIIGFDAMLEIETWHRWQELLASTDFIVAVRPGFSLKKVELLLERNGFRSDPGRQGRWHQAESNYEIRFLAGEIADISSTDIRARIAAGKPWAALVPPPVERYIINHRLYRT